MSSEDEHEPSETAATREDQRSNRGVLVIVGLVTLAVLVWNLYVQLVAR